MDIRDRVMGDQPNDFFHKIAGIIPGYNGYQDRERRRDADKLLRTELARRYTAQRDRLNRVQQTLARNHRFESIAEVDRIVGVFQRFIDRLNTATYGYTGLFDPVKVEAADLDQIYAFDMALASGVDQVSTAIDAVDSASTPSGGGTATPELPPALDRLAALVDELNTRLNQRSEYLTSGRKMPEQEYKAIVGGLNDPSGGGALGRASGGGPGPSGQPGYQPGSSYDQSSQGYQGGGYNQPSQTGYTGGAAFNPQGGPGTVSEEANLGSGAYSKPGGGADTGSSPETGTPTTNLNMQSGIPNEPGMGNYPSGDPTTGGASDLPGSGIQTASSPTHSTDPGSPGQRLSEGTSMASSLGTPDDNQSSGLGLGGGTGLGGGGTTPATGTGTGTETTGNP